MAATVGCRVGGVCLCTFLWILFINSDVYSRLLMMTMQERGERERESEREREREEIERERERERLRLSTAYV